jgi:hypothetical protein
MEKELTKEKIANIYNNYLNGRGFFGEKQIINR